MRTRLVVGLAVVLLLGLVGAVVALTRSSGDDLTVYTARSHYGEEKPFEDFTAETGEDIELFGGSASELYERIRNEGADSKADLLITVDAANLWRAKEAGLLKPITTAGFAQDIPAELRAPDGAWSA